MGRTVRDRIAETIARHDLVEDGARVVVGVSGGVDSMVTLTVLRRLGYDVHALHVNYGMRQGADADEALVRRWCAQGTPEIPLCVVALDAEQRANARDESLQEAARALRYDALGQYAEDLGVETVVVGHHRDDQAETLLLNLLRGAGPEGLAGMPVKRPLESHPAVTLVRPLLEVAREQIRHVAETEAIPWRNDPSNRDPSYDRARLRTEVMPLLQENFPGAPDALARAARQMRAYVEETLTPALESRLQTAYEVCDGGGRLRLDVLRREAPVWRRRLVLAALEQTMPQAPQTDAFAREAAALVDAQVGRRVEVGGGTIWRTRRGLRFLPSDAAPTPLRSPVTLPIGETVSVEAGTVRVDPDVERPEDLAGPPHTVEYVDADRLTDPLTLRAWREGDRIQPLGMEGTKSVADLLTDAQIPPHRREATPVLFTGDRPAWIVGHRLDRRVRIRPSTTRIARFVWHPREKASDDCNSP